MYRVFVSSVMRDFAPERTAVKNAIESLGFQALMAETAAASPDPSRQALLPLVEQSDAVVLILGARYGYVAEAGTSPTEDEFNHARTLAKPIFVFVQKEIEREPEQEDFVARVSGGWEHGTFTGFFSEPSQLALGVVKALTTFLAGVESEAATPEAQQRALDLAAGDNRQRNPGTNAFRVALVPVGAPTLIDALVLDDGALADRAAAVLRQHGLVPHAAGIDVQATSQGLVLTALAPREFHTTVVTISSDGAITTDVSARADGSMGGMAISYPRVEAAIGATSAAAQDLWALVPKGDLVSQIAVAVCVPDANHHPLSLSGQTGAVRWASPRSQTHWWRPSRPLSCDAPTSGPPKPPGALRYRSSKRLPITAP